MLSVIKKLQASHHYFSQKFTIAWLVFTAICVLLIGFYQWERLRLQHISELELNATRFAFKVETLFENVLQPASLLPFYMETADSCKTMSPRLKALVFSNFFMTGILISNLKNNLTCSTINHPKNFPVITTQKTLLFGPVKIESNTNHFFFLQQRIGHVYLGVFLLKSLLDTWFRNAGNEFDFIGLYDKNQKKMIFNYGSRFSNSSLLTHTSKTDISVDNHNGDVILPIENVDNVSLVLSTRTFSFINQWMNDLFFLLPPFILLSGVFYFYSNRLIRKRFSLTYALSNALKEGEFYPVYQAIRDEENHCFCGAEVLIRWETRFHETIMPDYFIDEAEKSGLIVPMTLALAETAFKECQSLFLSNPAFHLAFNLSPSHFRDEHFFTQFYELCTKYRIPTHQLMLELTERELFNQDESEVIERMRELRASGYDLAMDDFGTGQSNLNYLHHFPFNYLKIDKLFINTIGTGALIETINQSIITIAQSLNLQIIAEGVETKAQLDYLRSKNVRYIQGWFYTKGLPYPEFALLLKNTNKDCS